MPRKKTKITALDLIILSLVAAGGTYFIYRLAVGLNYRWDWGVIPQYLFRYDQEAGAWVPNLLIQGLFTTIKLSFWSTILATLIGTVMGIFRVSASLFKRILGRTFVEAIRNLPPLVLIFIFYFFVSEQIMPWLGLEQMARQAPPALQQVLEILFAPPARISAFASALITLSIYEGAYITEIVRAGIESIEKGQWEAGHALGLSWWQQMRKVILPQATQRILPPLAGQFISTIKDSAIVSVISIQELTFQGMELMSATYLTFEVWITVTLMYLILTLSLSLAVGRLEHYMRRSQS
ncbi:MAG: amino acid ABC transporter permease [Desulfarculaceae bacterium]